MLFLCANLEYIENKVEINLIFRNMHYVFVCGFFCPVLELEPELITFFLGVGTGADENSTGSTTLQYIQVCSVVEPTLFCAAPAPDIRGPGADSKLAAPGSFGTATLPVWLFWFLAERYLVA